MEDFFPFQRSKRKEKEGRLLQGKGREGWEGPGRPLLAAGAAGPARPGLCRRCGAAVWDKSVCVPQIAGEGSGREGSTLWSVLKSACKRRRIGTALSANKNHWAGTCYCWNCAEVVRPRLGTALKPRLLQWIARLCRCRSYLLGKRSQSLQLSFLISVSACYFQNKCCVFFKKPGLI